MVRQEQFIFVNQECESVKPGGDGIRQIVDIHQVRLGDTKKKKKIHSENHRMCLQYFIMIHTLR